MHHACLTHSVRYMGANKTASSLKYKQIDFTFSCVDLWLQDWEMNAMYTNVYAKKINVQVSVVKLVSDSAEECLFTFE